MSPLRFKVRDIRRELIAATRDPMDAVVLAVRLHKSVIQFNGRIVWSHKRDWVPGMGFAAAVLQIEEKVQEHYEEYRAKHAAAFEEAGTRSTEELEAAAVILDGGAS